MEGRERVISIQDGNVVLREVTSRENTGSDDLFPKDERTTWDSSEAWMDWHGNTATPTLEIGDSTIWVYHQALGGGHVDGTRLNGPSGNYYFRTPGTYTVVPGKYTHAVDGYIGGSNTSSRIASGIRYKKPKS